MCIRDSLYRELAPISDAAWSEIEEETTRTLKRYLAGRRVVDVPSPGGIALPGVATGHLQSISAPAEGIVARLREVKPLVAVSYTHLDVYKRQASFAARR